MKSILLVDLHQWSQTRIPYYFLVRALTRRFNSKVLAFRSQRIGKGSFRPNFVAAIHAKRAVGHKAWNFYRDQLGTVGIVTPHLRGWGRSRIPRHDRLGFPEAPRGAEELERLEIDGALVGDLIYDAYCKHHNVPSPDFETQQFLCFFLESMALARFWTLFFENNQVSAVVGNSVYLQGIPLRIAVSRGIPTFTANLAGIDRLSHANPYEDSLFRHYPEWAAYMPTPILAAGMKKAEKTLEKLLRGENVPRKNLYDGPSAFSQKLAMPGWEDDGRDSAVIVPHDFFDSSHLRGNHFYPDFLLWLWRLGELSREVDLNWWIKAHPRESDSTLEILSRFQEEFPHIRTLPSTVNPGHLDSIRARVALTVKGTVAGEYPLLGIGVLNASTANFHIRYGFSHTPRNRQDYEELVLGLPMSFPSYNLSGVHEFFFLRHIVEYEGTFLAPKEISEFDWTRGQSWEELFRMYSERRSEQMDMLVDCFLEKKANWLRGSQVLGLDENGKFWVNKG